jgi:hypothetical protein
MSLRPLQTVCALAFAAALFAQPPAATLSGTITFPDGAAVPKAPIQLKNKITGATARTTSKPDGTYQFTNLTPGDWDFSIVMPCCAYGRVNRTYSWLNQSVPRMFS